MHWLHTQQSRILHYCAGCTVHRLHEQAWHLRTCLRAGDLYGMASAEAASYLHKNVYTSGHAYSHNILHEGRLLDARKLTVSVVSHRVHCPCLGKQAYFFTMANAVPNLQFVPWSPFCALCAKYPGAQPACTFQHCSNRPCLVHLGWACAKLA